MLDIQLNSMKELMAKEGKEKSGIKKIVYIIYRKLIRISDVWSILVNFDEVECA
jgi:hypothetical protein